MSSIVLAEHQQTDITAIENVIAKGDLSQLNPQERVDYYMNVCRSLGLNPFTKPFDYISLKGKLTLYATRGATDQLRDVKHVNVVSLTRETVNDLCIVTATVELPDGRRDTSTGIVAIGGLRGEELANALMKAETKAKRRATLSICGLSWMDETEVETVAGARRGSEYTRELADAGVIDAATVSEGDFDAPSANGGPQVSQRQFNYLFAVAAEKGWDRDLVKDCARHTYGVESLNDLSRQQASELIERVQTGPKWVDPRQQSFDVPIEVEAREISADPEGFDHETAAPMASDYWDDSGRLIRWAPLADPEADIREVMNAAKAAMTPAQMTELRRFVKELGLDADADLHGALVARHKELSAQSDS